MNNEFSGEIQLPDFDDLKKFVVKELFERVKRRTPVKTGKAVAGWYIDGDTIHNDVPYVFYLEEGTIHMAPIHMIALSIEEVDIIMNAYFNRQE